MPVLIRNKMQGPTVLNLKEHDAVILESMGDPMGNDVQRIPDAAAQDVNFLKAIDAGMITIESAPEDVKQALELQRRSFDERRNSSAAAAQGAIDRQQSNDYAQVECIGPSPTGRGTCGTAIPVREATRNSKPPLCTAHESLSTSFVQVEDVDAPLTDEGKTPSRWKRVTMTAPQRDNIIGG